MDIKINIPTAVKLMQSNKDFIFFNYDENNKLINYTLSNDITRYKKKYQTFRVMSCIKRNINTITI